MYVHGSRESCYEEGAKLGLTGEALKMFSFVLEEYKLTLEVDMETGKVTPVMIDGLKIEAKS